MYPAVQFHTPSQTPFIAIEEGDEKNPKIKNKIYGKLARIKFQPDIQVRLYVAFCILFGGGGGFSDNFFFVAPLLYHTHCTLSTIKCHLDITIPK